MQSDRGSEWITEKTLAAETETSSDYWVRLRYQGGGPPYVKLGSARNSPVRYRRSDVEAWLAARTRSSTFDERAVA